jgi:uncharacterized protein (UPF0262 family)
MEISQWNLFIQLIYATNKNLKTNVMVLNSWGKKIKGYLMTCENYIECEC